MKKNKALFVLNIIILIVLVLCLVFNAILLVDFIGKKIQADNNPEPDNSDNFEVGITAAFLIVFQAILMIPYAVCILISVISMCKKYFNWLSITNAVLCGIAVIITIAVFLFVRGNPA